MSNTTNHQLKYFAWEITKQRSSSDESRIAQSLFDAQVDVNPHQIEAALFALSNPLSRGVVLADEVGLGKTIEAALVLCQYWAEYRRDLLIVCPASLRKQWALELQDKFNLPVQVLDLTTWRKLRKEGVYNPFENKKINIISYPFASRMEHELAKIPWDMVVIDEAHRLRNAHRSSNKTGNSLKKSLAGRNKLLLTATPLQNSLMELYGLSTVIDEHLFGDDKAFRRQYVNEGNLTELKRRLDQFVHRTLRKDVLEYIPYTERHALTVPFTPSDEEQQLYDLINSYLQRDFSYAFPRQQRHLISIVLRKLLASSTSAVIATLQSIRSRLQSLLDNQTIDKEWIDHFILEEDIDEELLDDFEYEAAEEAQGVDSDLLKAEIAEVDQYLQLANKINEDEKSYALLTALDRGFARMLEMGAPQKAVIFTESRRTQQYLLEFLESYGFAGKVVAFNGSNNSSVNTGIYQKWLTKHYGSDRVTGSPAIDRRTALIDYFREEAQIMIATEAAAEGVNLQFCSLVVNYDLPWNPQRVEQRIGRCHRYGQAFDVVVVNFINERNAADQRVMELLSQKFELFDGVFGASNEILGTIESGLDFEKRILEIYDKCRTNEEIEESFNKLQDELEAQINQKMLQTRELLLEHFDADIHELLKMHKQKAEEQLDRISRFFWRITRSVLSPYATFHPTQLRFSLEKPPTLSIKPGSYQLIRKGEAVPDNTHIYRLTHPLGEYVLNAAKSLSTNNAEVVFDYSNYSKKVSSLESLIGQSGWLAVSVLSLDSFAKEEHVILTGVTDSKQVLDADICSRMLRLAGHTQKEDISTKPSDLFESMLDLQHKNQLSKALEDNQVFFKREQDKIEDWAEDQMMSAESALDDIKLKIKSLKREARQAETIEEQKSKQEALKKAEREQRKLRQNIFNVEDEIEERRDALIENLENMMHKKSHFEVLYRIRWQLT